MQKVLQTFLTNVITMLQYRERCYPSELTRRSDAGILK